MKFKLMSVIALLLIISCGGNDNATGKRQVIRIVTHVADSTDIHTEGSPKIAKLNEALEDENEAVRVNAQKMLDAIALANEKLEALYEKYNVEVELVQVEDTEWVTQMTQSVLAGDPVGHVLYARSIFIPELAPSEIIVPTTSIVNPSKEQLETDWNSFNGEYYGITPRYDIDLDQRYTQALWYNKKMVQEAGLPDPAQQWVDGEWTWDALLEFTRGIKPNMPEGSAPLTSSLYGVSYHDRFSGANGVMPFDSKTNSINVLDPNYIATIEFLQQLYQEGAFTEPPLNDNGDPIFWKDATGTFQERRAAMTFAATWQEAGFAKTIAEDGYGAVPFPVGPNVTDRDAQFIAPSEPDIAVLFANQNEIPLEVVYEVTDMYLFEYRYILEQERRANPTTPTPVRWDENSQAAFDFQLEHMAPNRMRFYSTGVGDQKRTGEQLLTIAVREVVRDGTSVRARLEADMPLFEAAVNETQGQ